MSASSARAAAFAGFCAIASWQWAGLVADPSPVRFALAALSPAVAAVLLLLLARGDRPAFGRALAAAAIVLGAATVGLIAVGLPAGELLPWRWDDLASSLERGLAGLDGEFEYPLRSANELAGPVLVAACPLLLVLAAILGFRPGRRSPVAIGGLLVALAAYAIPATSRPTSAPALWGVVVLGLVALWLWGPRMRRLAAVVLVAGFGGLAALASGALAADEPPIDYEGWTLGADDDEVKFSWDHSYGPLRWPRDGRPVFSVVSDGPGYWKAESLDEFYSTGWRRSVTGGDSVPLPAGLEPDSRWVRTATFTVSGLEGEEVLTSGSPLEVAGIEVETAADGTLTASGDQPQDGTEYAVTGYAPNPSPRRLQASAARYPEELRDYTTIWLPVTRPRTSLSPASELVTPEQLVVPPWGAEPRPRTVHAIEISPYAQVRRLTHRLVADEPTPYAAVRAIERYLERNHRYRERPPGSRIPLRAFLFRDRIGYCQHFSGAMALMLRMAGIPARVAVGFSPGTPIGFEGQAFEVTDLDAHSWVEVYFTGIGWVTFDPTPAASPASSQISELGGSAFRFAPDGGPAAPPDARAADLNPPDSAPAQAADGSGRLSPVGVVGLLALAVGAVALAATGIRSARHRRLDPDRAAERQLAELPAALRAAGASVEGQTTLLGLEARLRSQRRPGAAAYLAGLREHRFRSGARPVPELRRRRRARRELGSRGGLAARLRLLAAMPPGGPGARSR